jgi:hypothetical protein
MKLITKAIQNALNKMPYGSQDGKGRDAKVIARYFRGHYTSYVLESDGGTRVFGLVDRGGGFEYGCFDLAGYEETNKRYVFQVERDKFVTPLQQTLGELMDLYGEVYPL